MKISILKILTYMYLLLVGICFITSDFQIDNKATYQLEVQIPADANQLWRVINNLETPIVSTFTLNDETTVYANDEYYLSNGYIIGEEYKNTASKSKNYNIKSYHQKYILNPLDQAMEKQDLDSILFTFQTSTQEEFIQDLNVIDKTFKVVSYGDYIPKTNSHSLVYITIFEFIFLILVFLLTLYKSRDSFSSLKSVGISKSQIIYFQITKTIRSTMVFSLLLVILNICYLTISFTFSKPVVILGLHFLGIQLTALVLLYAAQVLVMALFISTPNFVEEIKSGKEYKNIQSFFIFFSFFSKVLFVCTIVFFTIEVPKIIDMSKVYFDWKRVEEYSTVTINNFKYLNGEKNYEADYDGNLDNEERVNVVHYFEQNFDASYIVGDKESFQSASNNDLNSSILQANYNYLKLIDFPEIDKVSIDEDTLLVPDSIKINNTFSDFIAEKYTFANVEDLQIVQYDDFNFYSYDTTENYEVGNNGYFENPLLFIPSSENNYAELYTIPFQEFFYKDDEGAAINEYYKAYDIRPENTTKPYSKYAEYSSVLHTVVIKFSILIFNILIIIFLYVMTLKISLDVYIKSNAKLLSIWTTIGISNFSKYKIIYIENTILSITASFFFIIGMVASPLDWVMFIEFLIFIAVDTMFIIYVIKQYESKNIINYLKGGA